MTVDNIIQAVILLTAVSAWYFLPKREVEKRKWGFVIILCSQPVWFIMSVRNGHWAVAFISIIYGINAIRGIRSHFFNGGGDDERKDSRA